MMGVLMVDSESS